MHCMMIGRILVSSCHCSDGYWLKITSSLSKDRKGSRIFFIDEEFFGVKPLSRWLRNYASSLPGVWRLACRVTLNIMLKKYIGCAPNIATIEGLMALFFA